MAIHAEFEINVDRRYPVTLIVIPTRNCARCMEMRSKHTVDVFNVCVSGLRIGSPQVIDVLTNTGYTEPEPRERLTGIGDRVADQVPNVRESAIEDFVGNNTVTQPVSSIYPIDDCFEPITQSEMRTIFGRDIDSGWDDFRMRYPHTRGTMSVSDIGFDDAREQAILCVGQQFGGLAGHGSHFVFERKHNGWSKLAEVGAWLS